MAEKNPKVLIMTQSNYARNTFVNALLSKGITLYLAENGENLLYKIAQYFPEIVVFDVINEDFKNAFMFAKQIKEHFSEEFRKTAIILLIGAIDKQTISTAIQNGVTGFIKSNATEDFVYNYIVSIYQKILGVPPERKYVRVKIDSNERIGIKFRSPVNSRLIIGQIKDISFGGIAVELGGAFPPESLAVGSVVKNMQFILDGKDIDIDGIAVAYQKKLCAFRFTDMGNEIIEIISQYIFKKICCI